MQDGEHGVPVRSQKLFLTSIPAAFMGYDLIEWLMDRLSIEDSLEAVHLANLLCQFGYYFPINELKNLLVKDDSSLYRFQTPYYWPSQHHTPDNIEYAIYLAKRSQRNRQRHGLEDYEVEAYNNLKKILASKWDFVLMQSEEQLKIAKDRKKGEKIINDSQEKAYWRVYRPPPGYTTVVESSPVPTREQRIKARSRTKEHLLEEVKFMRDYAAMSRAKVSQVAEGLIDYTDTFLEFDPVLNPVGPSNPWISDDQTFWMLNQPIVDTPTEKRVRKWSISLEDLVVDSLGVKELMEYMKKEYSHENLRFWMSVQELRYGPGTEAKIKKKVKEIWDEFLSPGAKAEINIDGQTMEATRQAMKMPSRYTYEVAAGHVYLLLLKKDCYPRFIRSESYKTLLANAINPGNQKKRFFNFPRVPKKQLNPSAPPGTVPGISLNQRGEQRTIEGFKIHGIHGAGQGVLGESPPEGHDETNTAFHRTENICPWELDDDLATCKSKLTEDKAGGTGHVRRGSDPTALASVAAKAAAAAAAAAGGGGGKTRHMHPSGTAAAVAAAAASSVTTAIEASAAAAAAAVAKRTASASAENSLDRGGSAGSGRRDDRNSAGGPIVDPATKLCSRVASAGIYSSSCADDQSLASQEKHSRHSEGGSPSAAGSSHHHHHHHHHHHGASKRAKNRSKRKKPSRASSSSATTCTTSTCTTAVGAHSPSSTKHAVSGDEVEGGNSGSDNCSSQQPPKQHRPPAHQHSAASLLSSVAAASVAMALEGQQHHTAVTAVIVAPVPSVASTTAACCPTATSGAVASAALAMMPLQAEPGQSFSAEEPPANSNGGNCVTVVTETSSKCTQTKLEDDDEAVYLGEATGAAACSVTSVEEDAADKLPPSPHVEEDNTVPLQPTAAANSYHYSATAVATVSGSGGPTTTTVSTNTASSSSNSQMLASVSKDFTAAPDPAAAAASAQTPKVEAGESAVVAAADTATAEGSEQGGSGGAEGGAAAPGGGKGELGTWASSTEVCPWEDEENRKESHAPFVKKYATLGYL